MSAQSTKILFVIDSLRFGGAERQLVELIKGLDRTKFEIYLCCLVTDPGGYTNELHKLGIKIKYFSRTFMFDIKPIIQISHYIKEMRIDLVHSFNCLGALFGVVAANLAGRKVVCSGIRDAKDQSLMHAVYKKIESVMADILVSNSVAGFTNRFKKNKQHFRVVYNGIDFNRFELNVRDTGNVKEELGVSGFSHIVGMVASLSDYKDHQTLFDAIPLVLSRFANTCFLLIGDGPKRESLLRIVKLQGLEKNVIFGGYRSDVDRIYPAMDVSVLVTRSKRHLEGISNSLLESMASGVPVIATAGGGTDEVIVHGRNGLMVPPADPKCLAESIIDVLSNPKKASAMAKTALQDVKARFNLERYVEDYVSLYHEVLKQR
jgi:glycosyltransferase involved in cell wall biosynthesis